MHVNLENAEKAIEAARKKAIELKTQMCIAVVDSGANLKAFMRMDDAWVGSIDIAIKKAKTACFFGMATGQLGKLSQPGKPLYGIEHSNEGLITFPGGVPIVDEDGVLMGAIGVSGSVGRERPQGGRGRRQGPGRDRAARASLADLSLRRIEHCQAPGLGAISLLEFAAGGAIVRPLAPAGPLSGPSLFPGFGDGNG